MLLENILQEKYIEYLKTKQIIFELEVGILKDIIDFKIEVDKKFIGVKVKADRSKVFSTIGQLLNAKRTFSDVYLLSTEGFYNEIYELLKEFGIQDNFGFIMFKNGNFITLSKPKVKDYYFNEKYYKPSKRKKTTTLKLDKDSINFLNKYKDEPFFCFTVAKEMKISMFLAQSKITGWKRFGLVENTPHIGLPKPFRVSKIPQGECISLQKPPS